MTSTKQGAPAGCGAAESLVQIGQTEWDIAIVGAGVAGAMAAALLAQRGRRVLLLEQSRWPREKVCGGCLSARAALELCRAGLASVLAHAQPIDYVRWHVGKQRLQLPAPGGCAITRSDLDAELVAAAVARGCTFLPAVSAALLQTTIPAEQRTLLLRPRGSPASVESAASAGSAFQPIMDGAAANLIPIRAAIVLACDGIGGTLLAREPWADWHIAPNAWIGLATLCESWSDEPPAGSIHMHIAPGGYLGLVRLADHRVHLAAALDPQACRRAAGPASLIARILGASRAAAPAALHAARFHGTAPLTRRRNRLGGHRVLAVGDACGYVEPFTGEGIAWALQCACAVVDLLPPPHVSWPANLPARWQAVHRTAIQPRQRWCRALRPMMHHPALAAAGLFLGQAVPALAQAVASHITQPPPATIPALNGVNP